MPFQNDILGGASGQGGGYFIENSLRFNKDDSSYLNRTPASASNRKTWTMSCWVKISTKDDSLVLMDAGSNPNYLSVSIYQGTIRLYDPSAGGGNNSIYIAGTQILRDPAAWYHIVVQLDTTQATNTNRVKIYVNNERETAFTQTDWPAQNYDSFINNNIEHTINQTGSSYSECYMADFHFVDGTALTPSSFGELDSDTNQWIPIEYTGSYGTNGFYLKFTADKSLTDFEDTSTSTTGSYQFVNAGALTCDYLLVGGGGGGGTRRGGGGGSGGFATASGQAVPAGTHNIYVGQGGQGMCGDTTGNPSPEPPRAANSGQDTIWEISGQPDIRAGGGGGGSSYGNPTSPSGGDGRSGVGAPRGGGSGGGGGAQESTAANPGGIGLGPGTARPGGPSNASQNYAGAGGGDSETGDTGGPSGAEGGDGSSNSYQTNSSIKYAGGGGSGNNGFAEGDGNLFGGGQGGNADGQRGSQPGWNGTGGGGGGHGGYNGGNGGTGIVIIRYQANSAQATGGTITTYGSGGSQYYVHTFEAAHKRKFMEAFGGVTHSTTQKKFGATSIRMDRSSSSYITASTKDVYVSGALALGAADFDPLQGNWTLECFVRFDAATASVNEKFFGIDYGSYSLFHFGRNSANAMTFEWYETQGDSARTMQYSLGATTSAGAGPSDTNWHHYALVRNGSNINMYFDGTSIASDSISGSPVIRSFNSPLNIGFDQNGGYVDGYMDEIRWSKTARYTTTFTPPAAAFTSDSDTVFLLQSDVTNTLGSDYSGNDNTFTATNLHLTDQMIDTPLNEVGSNFCTLNPLTKPASAVAYSEGNLAVTSSATSYPCSLGTIGVSTGKWYFEVLLTSTNDNNNDVHVGWWGDEANKVWDGQTNTYNGSGPSTMYYGDNGNKNINGTSTSYGTTYTTGDIIGATINFDDGEFIFYKNNIVQNGGTAIDFVASVTAAKFMIPGVILQGDETVNVNFGQDSSFAGWQTPQGNTDSNDVGDFYYTPPTGFLAICSANLSDPEIALPGENFNTIIWQGTGGDRAFTGVGFQPDFVWGKPRNQAYPHQWVDSVRVAPNLLYSSEAGAQVAGDANGDLASFDSDGFSTEEGSGGGTNYYWNRSGAYYYVAWTWKAGGAPTVDNSAGVGNTPTAGSVKINGSNSGSALGGTIAATRISANTTNGFSIVKYSGNSTSGATVGHELSVAPELIIVKNLSITRDWQTYDVSGGATKYLQLNNSGGYATDSARWNNTEPTASVFSLGSGNQVNGGNDYIAYCWHSIEGYSKVGEYIGNLNADGPFAYTGFKPTYVLLKNTARSGNWQLFDGTRNPYNVIGYEIYPDENTAGYNEYTNCDFLSNGFKIRASYTATNASGESIIYMAFAENPFKTSNAR